MVDKKLHGCTSPVTVLRIDRIYFCIKDDERCYLLP